MAPPRRIRRHAFVRQQLVTPQHYDEREYARMERELLSCAEQGCKLPYEWPVHWVLDEEPAELDQRPVPKTMPPGDGLLPHTFTTPAIRLSQAQDLCDYGARCRRRSNDPLHVHRFSESE